MSVFDSVVCEPDLPDGWNPPKRLCQSKDFGGQMLTHTITKDGRLLIEHPIGDDIHRFEALGFSGTFRFYDVEILGTTASVTGRRYVMHQYEARFENGRLASIVVVPE